MKKVAIVLLFIGILATLFGGYRFATQEKVLEIGNLQLTKKKDHSLYWSPIVGIALVLAGAGLLYFGTKKGTDL